MASFYPFMQNPSPVKYHGTSRQTSLFWFEGHASDAQVNCDNDNSDCMVCMAPLILVLQQLHAATVMSRSLQINLY